jgi:hypothetical protein
MFLSVINAILSRISINRYGHNQLQEFQGWKFIIIILNVVHIENLLDMNMKRKKRRQEVGLWQLLSCISVTTTVMTKYLALIQQQTLKASFFCH